MTVEHSELVWPTLLPKHGAIVQVFLSYLFNNKDFIDDARFAIQQIAKETTIGPLIAPTAYLDGQRFANADQYQNILLKLIELCKSLKEST